jgi:hypothetical protein
MKTATATNGPVFFTEKKITVITLHKVVCSMDASSSKRSSKMSPLVLEEPARNLSSKVILTWSKGLKTLSCVSHAYMIRRKENKFLFRFILLLFRSRLAGLLSFPFHHYRLCLAELSKSLSLSLSDQTQ